LQKFSGIFDLRDEIKLLVFKSAQIGAASLASFYRQNQINDLTIQGYEFNSAMEAFFDKVCERNPVIPGIAPAAVFDSDFEH